MLPWHRSKPLYRHEDQQNQNRGSQRAQSGANVLSGGNRFAMETAQAIDSLHERVESHPGNRHGAPQEERREDEVQAGAAELRFVSGEHADQLRQQCQGERQIDGEGHREK